MYIDQIPANSKITIAFDYVTKSTKLDATVKGASLSPNGDRSVITDVVKVDGKIVNINNFRGKVSVSFASRGTSRSELWKQVKVKYDRVKKEYVLSTKKESEKHERRKAQRIPLGLGATVQIDGDSRRHNCTIFDISTTGVGLRMETLNYNAVGKDLTLSFSDKAEFATFNVNCRCVREVNRDNNKSIYGCTIRRSQDLLAYIRKKQDKYSKSSGRKQS